LQPVWHDSAQPEPGLLSHGTQQQPATVRNGVQHGAAHVQGAQHGAEPDHGRLAVETVAALPYTHF